ncbi:uncharacterized protein B0I36DRAFT_319413 [Microdochium trichocladiopsis]|uniref:Zn(2)-C6 fungal-type domain-containing protein n=1 Tax=Microdochium trichocladiopsis TaxID=1682393 RepID=A0A9P9BXC4_9PEZI|nr:uncharacterized protein B0I36DRAFT_319413 [Microdochium trichocladiopsis]KAH7035941.1 hypothetical protein B0I36DRAFT_319413 [Microdochium trichocladiopsis]
MADSGVQSSAPDVKDEERLASCFNCKRSKLKCVRPNGSGTCTRCHQRGVHCTAPAYHVGRHKGVKNKHTGLEKAVLQIEQALKRAARGGEQIQDPEQANELRYLLDKSRDFLHADGTTAAARQSPKSYDALAASQRTSSTPRTVSSDEVSPAQASVHSDVKEQSVDEEQLNLDDAENPLQLLARTSELLSTIAPRLPGSALSSLHTRFAGRSAGDGHLQTFFGGFNGRLDVGDDLDPIELGLVTLAEAEALFSYFFDKLAHTRWGIDPVIHTVDFVRRRSAYLLTSIAAASAMFLPSMEALYKRLSNHRRHLAGLIMSRRFKSVEIILAFMVNVPWLSAGEHWADDETSTYMSMALTIALDLSINKIILPVTAEPNSPRGTVASSECISAKRALAVDGFAHVDPNSLMGQRLLRRRERVWLSLFVLERGVCLARGRQYVLPMSPLIESCDQWHLSDLADRWDGSIVSVAVLRRDLANLIAKVRGICDSYAEGTIPESSIVDKLKSEITQFFDRWYHTWPLQIGDREQLALPPYVEILASHTRLSMYSSVINHTSAPACARHYFRAAGLSSALNVLRVAVQGEGQLRSMPNNTAIMISFAACFALRVSTVADGQQGGAAGAGGGGASALAPSIRTLILETVEVLDRIGSTPVQRKGLSCLFAGQLRQILKLAASGSASSSSSLAPTNAKRLPAPPSVMSDGQHHHQQRRQTIDAAAAASHGGGSNGSLEYAGRAADNSGGSFADYNNNNGNGNTGSRSMSMSNGSSSAQRHQYSTTNQQQQQRQQQQLSPHQQHASHIQQHHHQQQIGHLDHNSSTTNNNNNKTNGPITPTAGGGGMLPPPQPSSSSTSSQHHHQHLQHPQNQQHQHQHQQSDYMLFSTMSTLDQLDDAIINNVDISGALLGVGADGSAWDDLQFHGSGTDLDWMDWSTFAPA